MSGQGQLKYELEQLQKKYKTLMEEKEEVLKQNKMLVLQAENEKVWLYSYNEFLYYARYYFLADQSHLKGVT